MSQLPSDWKDFLKDPPKPSLFREGLGNKRQDKINPDSLAAIRIFIVCISFEVLPLNRGELEGVF
jgi:hypothetical protein